MEKIVPISAFHWQQFLVSTAEGLAESVTDEYVVLGERDERVEYFEDHHWRNMPLLDYLADPASRLIVHFAVDNLEDGLVCADGALRPYVDPAIAARADEEAYEAALDAVRQYLHTGEETAIGYRIRRLGDDLAFEAVEMFGGSCGMAPCNEALDEGAQQKFFKTALEDYLDRFVG